MKADLHSHTIYSDGVLTPEELIIRAKNNGVDVLALTDHDSCFGCEEAFEAGLKHGVKVIKGLELSTVYNNESIHIICLFKNNVVPKEMMDFSINLRDSRRKRAILMMEKIRDIYNVKIDLDKLFEGGTIITRANMCRNIMECNNMSYEEASVYVSNNSKAYIHSTKMSVEEGLKLARSANCLVILAHPCLYKEENLLELLELGFDGIEAKYANKKNDEAKFRHLAEKYNLIISAGSDCHGDNSHADVGTSFLDDEEFSVIKNKLNL